ncbi:hypothetical protein [Anaerosporobacter sp.]|uniref:hypothetical protein n=1 Tax=Anaerosporobacter sp. TaxID=1872529 RepID=UPI00286F1E8C|nr:hypothetical protein [Anaerosporobacter sp.]
MKKITKSLIAVLALCLAFALTGCSDKKAEKKYHDDVEAIQSNIILANSTMLTDLQTFIADVTNEDAKAKVLEDIKTMETEFTTLRDLTAPKRYKEAQIVYKEAAEEGLKGTEDYSVAIQNCTEAVFTDQTANDEFMTRITEGDDHITAAGTKISEASQIANEANK